MAQTGLSGRGVSAWCGRGLLREPAVQGVCTSVRALVSGTEGASLGGL